MARTEGCLGFNTRPRDCLWRFTFFPGKEAEYLGFYKHYSIKILLRPLLLLFKTMIRHSAKHFMLIISFNFPQPITLLAHKTLKTSSL